MHFRFFSGDSNWKDYGGIFLSKKLNNGEFAFYLAIVVINWLDAVGEREVPATYNVELVSVSPQEARDSISYALGYCGLDNEENITELMEVDALLSYGTYATLWSQNGNNIKKILKEAHKQAEHHLQRINPATDKPCNGIYSVEISAHSLSEDIL